MREPGLLDIVIFRENTEDVYAGIEWPAGSAEVERLGAILRDQFGAEVRERSATGVKPMSEYGSQATHPRHGPPCDPSRAAVSDPRAEGQHHEVHRGCIPELGL